MSSLKSLPKSLIVAVDTGGTFTDIAAYDQEAGTVVYAKALTTYDDLVDGVMACVAEAGLDFGRALLAKHGTTLVINTLLQRSGARDRTRARSPSAAAAPNRR
jgi:N-methylhydantoinase A